MPFEFAGSEGIAASSLGDAGRARSRGPGLRARASYQRVIASGCAILAALVFSVDSLPAGAQTSGLVAGYPFSEGTGTTTADVSGNNNTGTLTSTTWTTAGQYGNALVFNGTSAFVDLGNPTTLQITGSMTISAWIKSSAFPGDDAAIVSRRNNDSLGYQLDTTVDTGPRTIGFKLTSSTGANMARYGATAMQVNTWYFVAGVYDATARTMNVYLNGVLDNGQTVGTITASQQNSTLNVNIGRRTGLSGFAFNGTIDEVRIYNRALSQAEIQADMATPLSGTPDTTPPTAPSALAATATSATQINLAWSASTDNVGVSGYRVERCQGTGCTNFAQIATPTTASFSDTGLTASTSYSYRVRAADAAGNLSAYSNVASASTQATPDTTPPTAPSVISAVVVSPSEIDLSWTASTDNVGVSGYQVDRCQGASCTNFVQIATPAGPSYNDLGLAASTAYRYRVRAFDAAGNVSANSSVVNATTQAVPDNTPPSAPSALSATASSTTQINLGWVAATDNVGVTGYMVERCQGAGCSNFVQIAAPTATSFNDTGLTASTSYSYRVRATDAAGNIGAYSNIATASTQAPDTTAPSAPSGLTATVAGSVQINLAWTASTDNVGVTGYMVERCQGASCTGFAQIAAPTATGFNDTGLTASTSYSYRVRATDAAGNLSAYSSVVSASTSAATGLVAAYPFNDGSGPVATDVSGNNNTGVLNGPTWTTAGQYGNALVFNGTSAFVDLGNPTTLQITGSMTISAWIKSSAFPADDAAVVSRRSAGGAEMGYQLDTTVDTGRRTIGFKLTNSSEALVALYGNTTLQTNQWYFVAGVYDATARTMNVYLNGVLDNGQAVGTITSAQETSLLNVNIGRRPGAAGFEFNGTIDEVRIYNRALSQAEIQADMAAPLGGGTPPPPDTTPPAVHVTSPAQGATVFNQISISALASDNVGVSAVQFLLDGAALGAEVTNTPYSVAWDTTTAATGAHTLQAVARDFAGNTATSTAVSVTVARASAALAGQWSSTVTTWPIVAVHSNLLPTGEILAWDGQTDGNDARLWNPTTGVFTSVPNNLTNIFCSGHCQMADGRVIVVGGHISGHNGLPDTNLFDSTTRTWTRVAPMNTGRWYATATALPDGRVLAMSGEINCAGCFAPIPEVYDPKTNIWTELTGASMSLPYYPHMLVLPDGRVLAASTAEEPIATQILDVNAQTWTVVDPNPVDGGSAAMYAPGKIIKSGRSVDPDQPVIPSVATTYVLDMNQATPAWREVGTMAFPRAYHTLTSLPDGTILVTGGGTTTDAVGVATAVLAAELWSPQTESWTTLSSMQKPRLYHSEALLLPDARVLVLGGGRFNGVNEPTDQLSSEFFSPPYLFAGARPTITSAPATTTYGATIPIQTPDAASIGSVSFIRLGSATHAFNENQRYVPLQFTAVSGGLNVQAPANSNLAPPGYYMLFILNTSGVPSVAAIMQIK